MGQSETLVIFMGIGAIHEIAREIMSHGRSGATPAIAVRWATRPDQETVTGTLATIADRIDAAHLKPPATVIIGEVAGLHDKLNWYEKLPLFGRKIVVTRAPDQAAELSDRLRALGADAVELPVISIQPPEDPAPLDRAIQRLSSYDWLIFTSVNGVRFFLDRLDGFGERSAVSAGAHLRDWSGHETSGRESAPESRSDAGRIRRRESGEGFCCPSRCRASACCCRGRPWRAT